MSDIIVIVTTLGTVPLHLENVLCTTADKSQ